MREFPALDLPEHLSGHRHVGTVELCLAYCYVWMISRVVNQIKVVSVCLITEASIVALWE